MHEIAATENVNVKHEVILVIPEGVVTSDSNLSGITLSDATGNMKTMDARVKINSIYWVEQAKTGAGKVKKLQKFIVDARFDQTHFGLADGTSNTIQSYLICDVFFEQEEGKYYIKALGSYSSLPKLLATNSQHQGQLISERHFTNPNSLTCLAFVSSDENAKDGFERRANPMYFWMELESLVA